MQRGITCLDPIRVGHWTNYKAQTGCTAIICPGAVAGVDVRGAAPGTRETDLLRGYNLVECVHAIMLSGGSAYGLDAASGAMQYLEENRIGLDVGVGVVPIVPSAVLFDLGVGDAAVRPGRLEGYAACEAATDSAKLRGRVGAGAGATIGKAFGMQHAMLGGFGSSFVELSLGVCLAALVVVNAFGDVYEHRTGRFIAGAQIDGRITPCIDKLSELPSAAAFNNTTLGIIATNAVLTREQANKLAAQAHNGFALSIRPVHTCMDGDTIFSLSTSKVKTDSLLQLYSAAAEVMAFAVEDAALAANKLTEAGLTNPHI